MTNLGDATTVIGVFALLLGVLGVGGVAYTDGWSGISSALVFVAIGVVFVAGSRLWAPRPR